MLKFYTLICLLLSMALNHSVYAELTQLSLDTITESEEPFSRRVYSYDFNVRPDGTIDVIYSKPVVGEDRARIIYMNKPVGGT